VRNTDSPFDSPLIVGVKVTWNGLPTCGARALRKRRALPSHYGCQSIVLSAQTQSRKAIVYRAQQLVVTRVEMNGSMTQA